MFLLLILLLQIGVSMVLTDEDMNVDITKVFPDNDLVDGGVRMELNEFQGTRYALHPSQVFIFNFDNCQELLGTNYQRAVQILKRAGERVATALLFRTQIRVNVRFRAESTRNAFGRPRYQYAARKDEGQLLMYSNAAMKQALLRNPQSDPVRFMVDMTLEFNSFINWYFGPEGGHVQEYEVDFERNNF